MINPAINGVWAGSTTGNWSDSSKWGNGLVPGGSGDSATFGANIGSSTATVTLDGARSVGSLTFNTTGGGSYLIGGTSTLTLSNTGSPAIVAVLGGNHTISTPVIVASALDYSAVAGSSLTLSGPISGGRWS